LNVIHLKKLSFYTITLALSLLCLLAVVLFLVTGHIEKAGPLCIAFFITLAIGCRGYAHLKGFAYTITIFAAVTTAMYYPFYFLQWNGFKLATLITPLIQLIMFGMGTSMGLKDFAGVIKTPKGVFIGVVSHFIIMPLIGFTLARLSGLPPEIAAGIILIGCSPNGMASNVISYLAKANLALSITITAVSTTYINYASSKFASTAPTTSASVSSMSRSHSPLSEVVSTGASSLDAEIDPVQLGKRMRELENGSDEQQIPHTTVIIQPPVNTATANDWTTALQRLNKGKTTLGREVCVCP